MLYSIYLFLPVVATNNLGLMISIPESHRQRKTVINEWLDRIRQGMIE